MKTNIAAIESDSVIVSMTRASQALAEAVTIGQTKTLIDVAHAAEIYSKRHHLSEEAIGKATAVKVEATIKLGEILMATPKNAGVKGSAVPNRNRANLDPTPTLEELGLSKKESAVAQKLAALPAKQLEQVRLGNVTITKAIAAIDSKPKATIAKPVTKPAPVAADDFGISDDELIEENTRVQTENNLLNDTIKSLQVSDKDAEIKKLQERVYGLEGRIQQLMGSEKAMESKLDYSNKVIHTLRKLLGVETHAQIIESVRKLTEKAA